MFPPGRIVCLTEETVATLYLLDLLGEQDRNSRDLRLCCAAGAGSPRKAPRERLHLGEYRQDPRAGARLVLTFSDLQADIAADLIRRGLNVHASNDEASQGSSI